MSDSENIEKDESCSILKPIRFKPSEVKKINSLRQVKRGKLEPFAKALHRFIKNAIYLNPEELTCVNETTQEYGIPPTPNNPKIAIMQFIEKANNHNGDNSSKSKRPSKPKRYSQRSRRSNIQRQRNPSNETIEPRTMFNGGPKQERDCPMGGGVSCEVCHVRAYPQWVKCQKMKQGLS